MRKFFGLVLVSLLLTSQVFAEVFYCIEKDANGFNFKNGNYQKTFFEAEKFTIKLDIPNLIINSSILDLYDVKCADALEVINCTNDYGDVITIDNEKPIYNNFDFVRGKTYGRSDSIYVSHGRCEKF